MFAEQRQAMVDGQLRTNKVTDPKVIDAFLTFPREDYVPEARKGAAYVDEDVDLGHGRVLMEPMIAARILQEAEIEAGQSVLVIGAGNGSLAGLVAQLGAEVVAQESVAALVSQGREAQPSLTWVQQDLTTLADGTFDRLITAGSVSSIPEAWAQSLKPTGRIFALISGQSGNDGYACVAHKSAGGLSLRTLFNASVPPLGEFLAAPEFEF